MDKNKIFLY